MEGASGRLLRYLDPLQMDGRSVSGQGCEDSSPWASWTKPGLLRRKLTLGLRGVPQWRLQESQGPDSLETPEHEEKLLPLPGDTGRGPLTSHSSHGCWCSPRVPPQGVLGAPRLRAGPAGPTGSMPGRGPGPWAGAEHTQHFSATPRFVQDSEASPRMWCRKTSALLYLPWRCTLGVTGCRAGC